jgi:hypothetical protein
VRYNLGKSLSYISMQIAVSSNCQTEGVANALMALCPELSLRIFILPYPLNEDAAQDVANKLDQIDAWVTIAPQAFVDKVLSLISGPPIKVIRIPAVGFSAFHPDLCYAKDSTTDELTRNHYNSAIGAWAYRNGLSVDQARKLFSDNIFRELGYYDMWEPSVSHLKNLFTDSGISEEFDSFWWSIRRSGNFMHSINHPHIGVLAKLARIVAIRLGISPESLPDSVEPHDNLDCTVWPLYPEVAQNLGISNGGYRWTIGNGRYVNGISAYLEYAFDDYQQQGIERNNLVILNRDNEIFDQVLGSRLGTL